jgi:hypothetical protein
VGGSTNYYNQNIITYTFETVGEGDNKQVAFKSVVLSNKYLPDIEIYQENGSIKFPNYQLEHGTNNISYKLSSLNQTSDTTSYQTASNALSNFKPIINALSELNEELSNFTVVNDNLTINTGKKNYYYNSNPSSGVK